MRLDERLEFEHMDLTYPTETDAFRTKIQGFLDDNLPEGWNGIGAVPPEDRYDFQMDWRRTLKLEAMSALLAAAAETPSVANCC